MVKGTKQYSSISNDGKWYFHTGLPGDLTRNRETCTTPGNMLSQTESSPKELQVERHPKWKKQKPLEHPFSTHDNRDALRDSISVFSQGLGRKKFDRRQHDPHFFFCHKDVVTESVTSPENRTVYQIEYTVKKNQEVITTRRFPHSHQERSANTAAQTREHFMWFGRHD